MGKSISLISGGNDKVAKRATNSVKVRCDKTPNKRKIMTLQVFVSLVYFLGFLLGFPLILRIHNLQNLAYWKNR